MATIVVIGAGVGGLAAATRLAWAGHDVTICEQAPQVGGKLGLFERDGFRFDTGPSLITMPQVLTELFADTGGAMDDLVDLVPVEPITRYRYPDGTTFDATADRAAMAERLEAALRPGSGSDWLRLLARAERIWRAVEQPFLRSPVHGSLGLVRQAVRVRDLVAIAPLGSLRGLARRYLRDPRLRMFLERYATYAGSDPRRAPAALAAICYAEQAFGAWYLRGGLYRLAEVLADHARRLGVTVRTGADVAEILLDCGKAAGVRLDNDEVWSADAVVANADAAHVYSDLLPAEQTKTVRRQLQRAEPSLSGFVMLLGVAGRTPGLAHHNVLFGADYDAEFDAIFGSHAHPATDPTLYVSVPPDAAPAGDEAWFVLVNAARQGQVDWPGLSETYGDHLIDLLSRRGLDIRDRIRFRQIISPADLAERTRAPGGAIYGTSANGPRAAFLRPANRSPVPGLFLVGGSSHPGGGLPLVALSAKLVADLIGPA